MSDFKLPCPACRVPIPASAMFCPQCGAAAGTPMDATVADSDTRQSPATPLMASPSVARTMRSGSQIREYRIERLLGEGGMGGVFLARHSLTGQRVAIKVIRPEKMADREFRLRFIEEARIMSIMRHPNVVHLMDFFEEDGLFLMVMEYMDQGSAETLLKNGLPKISEAVRITSLVLRALDYAHSLPTPVIHRDIKPENILLGPRGTVAVTDFGICRAEGRQRFTQTGCVVGTLEYMAPEVIVGEEAVAASDQYSLGITLYKLLTGNVPFQRRSNTGLECMHGHVRETPPPPSMYRSDIPPALEAIVLRSLAKNPSDRFATCGEMQAALQQLDLQGEQPVTVPPPRQTPVPPAVVQPLPEQTQPGATTSVPLGSGRSSGMWIGLAMGMLVTIAAAGGWYALFGPGASAPASEPPAAKAWGPSHTSSLEAAPPATAQQQPVAPVAPQASPTTLSPAAPAPAPAQPAAAPAPAACSRECSGRACGDDGCGGSCGQCETNYECNQGTCTRAAWWLERRKGAELAATSFFSAWNRRDPGTWERLFHPDYKSETHWGQKTSWDTRRERIDSTAKLWKRIGWLSVHTRDMRITMSEDATTATVTFFQEYRSESYNSDGNGSLELVWHDGKWQIIKENFTGVRKFL